MARGRRSKGGKGKRSNKDPYRSNLEREFAKNLKARSVDFGYETEKISYVIDHKYCPDFILEKKDGTTMIIEVKGFLDSSDRRKMLAVKKQNPDLDIRFIFGDSQKKIIKGSKTTYAIWSKKNGFKFADKSLPSEWKKELL